MLLELLHALAISDGLATGPAAWNDWKATLVADLVRRVGAALAGEAMPGPSRCAPISSRWPPAAARRRRCADPR